MDASEIERLRALQLAMNRQSWAKFVELGVTPGTPLALDFTFEARDRAAAEALAAYLQQNTNYQAEADEMAEPAGAWGVFGSTPAQGVTLEFLDEWVTWMIGAGAHFECAFDGWGASLGKR
jgi:hypothetical protein